MPDREHGMNLFGGLAQIIVPLPDDGWIQIIRSANRIKLLAGQLVHVEHGIEVFDGLIAQAIGEFIAFFSKRGVQLLLALVKALDELRVLLVLVEIGRERQGALGRTVKNAVERVIILRRNRIVLVIVAA